jgi:hypothetical protein
MSDEKFDKITTEGTKIYLKLADKLRKEFPANYYVAIDVESEDYYVGEDSVKVLKEARRKHPRKTFFGAHVGYLAGRI